MASSKKIKIVFLKQKEAYNVNIMLIDDDEGCLDSLKSSLELQGHKCTAFSFPEKAIEDYSKNYPQYDAVITDMKMPVMTGLDVLKQARTINKDTKVIIITAYGDVETAISAVNNRAYAFFGKPLNFKELMETLDKIKNEKKEQKIKKEEFVQLSAEYSKLKKAYEDMQKILNKNKK